VNLGQPKLHFRATYSALHLQILHARTSAACVPCPAPSPPTPLTPRGAQKSRSPNARLRHAQPGTRLEIGDPPSRGPADRCVAAASVSRSRTVDMCSDGGAHSLRPLACPLAPRTKGRVHAASSLLTYEFRRAQGHVGRWPRESTVALGFRPARGCGSNYRLQAQNLCQKNQYHLLIFQKNFKSLCVYFKMY